MGKIKDITGVSEFEFYEYIIKCLIGVLIGYPLYKAFPQQSNIYAWVLISILLSITHDNNSKMAYDRMKGNLVGASVGLLTFFLASAPNLYTICLGITLVIIICFYFKLIAVSRTALVAFIIVVMYEEAHDPSTGWEWALYRMLGTVLGCFIGLIINYYFRMIAIVVSKKYSQIVHRRIVDEDPSAE
jgi:uncharacterized membrane protein YgaE (UPF0421/DUF939 family)